jgi:hypothetical protein
MFFNFFVPVIFLGKCNKENSDRLGINQTIMNKKFIPLDANILKGVLPLSLANLLKFLLVILSSKNFLGNLKIMA